MKIKTRPIIQQKTPRQRFFDKEFKVGDKVCIIRTERGWFNMSKIGYITALDPMICIVQDMDGHFHEINHPRDIILYR